jgi:hypothetical protein
LLHPADVRAYKLRDEQQDGHQGEIHQQ